MRKSIRRIVCMTAAFLVLFSLAPAPARAVDPVSAATMANALAQAITAYGASQGVSMMYDVTDTNGIGEGVHDLWDQFKTDVNDNDVPTYDSLAVTTWSTIYKKVGNSVAINLSDTVVSYLDRFWNWLLSGPAEMEKVDNQYYQWTLNQDNTVSPIVVNSVISSSLLGYPVYVVGSSNFSYTSNGGTANVLESGYVPYVGLQRLANGFSDVAIIAIHDVSFSFRRTENGNTVFNSTTSSLNNGKVQNLIVASYAAIQTNLPFPTINQADYLDLLNSLSVANDNELAVLSESDDLSIRPYVGAETPENVYLPDNDDVNYQPLPYVGPLNIPWQNAWGDGETVTDAIGTSIAGALDDAIVDDGTLELEGDNTVNPPIDDVIGGPDDYQVPGLADVFPFCIPFDIYNFLSALAADPVAPHFTAQLDFPSAIGGTQTIDIDFDSPTWNQLAQLLRLLELLAFIVGLALLTRSMFIRG